MFTRRFRRDVALALVVAQVAGPLAPALHAAPVGGIVTHGAATIDTSGALTRITQTTDRAIINWSGFSTAAGESVRFDQTAGAAVLNRVTGTGASVLAGSLSASGQVYILNPNGILFAAGSRTDVGSLVASTLSMKDEDFLGGRYELAQGATPLSSVINRGKITAADGGMVALVAPVVSNEGEITAAMGRVVLGAGTHATLSPDGQGLINLTLPAGQAGEVMAAGEAAGDMLRAAVKQPRIVEGGEVVERDGHVFLQHAEGLAINAGVIETPGAPGQSAGQVVVTGTQAAVAAPGSRISANGCGSKSSGGSIKLLSPGTAVFAPKSVLEAHAGASGDGGFVEVSACRDMGVAGTVSVGGSAGGKVGTFLIDPRDIVLVPGGGSVCCRPPCAPIGAPVNPVFFNTGRACGTISIGICALTNICSGAIILEAQRNFTFATGAGTTHVFKPATTLTIRTQGQAGGSITAPCAGQRLIETGCGTITIQAGTDPTLAAAPVTLSNLTLQTTNRAISITSGTVGGDLTIGPMSAGTGPVTLFSPAGSILDPTAAQITADVVSLRAGNPGVAVAAIGTAAAPIKLNATRIDATSRATSGLINIKNDPATPVIVSCISTGAGNVTFAQCGGGPLTVQSAFTGNGSISITNTGTNLTVGNAIAAAGTGGVALSVTAGDLVTTGEISGNGAAGVTLTNTNGDIQTGAVVESVGGAVAFTATGGAITTSDLIRATGGTLTLNATGGPIVTNGRLLTPGANAITLTTNQAAQIAGQVDSGASFALTAPGGISVTAPINTATTLALDASNGAAVGGPLAVSAALNAGTTATLLSETKLQLTAAGSITAGGAVTINNTDGDATPGDDILIDGFVKAAGPIAIASTTGGIATTGRLATTGANAITLTSASFARVGGAIDSGAAATVTSATDLSVTAPITAATVLTLDSSNGVNPGGTLTVGAALTAGTTASLLSEKRLQLTSAGSLTAGGAVAINNTDGDATPGDDVLIDGFVKAAGAITVASANGGIATTGRLATTGANAITLTSASFARVGGAIDSGAAVTVTSVTDISVTAPITAATLLTLNATNGAAAGGALTVDAALNGGTGVTLQAETRITTTANGSVASGGAVNINNVDGDATPGDDIAINGLVDATGAITIASVNGGISTTGRLTTTGANAITLNSASFARVGGAVDSGAAVAVTGPTGVTIDAPVRAGTSITLDASNGAAAGGAVLVNDTLDGGAGGAITITAETDIRTTAAITGQAGVTLTNADGDATPGGDVVIGAPVRAGAALQIVSTAGAALGGQLIINAPVSAGTDLTLAAETDLTVTAAGSAVAGTGVTLTNVDGDANPGRNIRADGLLRAGTTVTVNGTGGATARLDLNGQVDATTFTATSGANGDLKFAGQLNATNAALTAGHALFFDGRGNLTGGAALVAQTDRLAIAGRLDAVGAVTLTSAGALDGPGEVTSAASITATGGATVGGQAPPLFSSPTLNISSAGTGDVIAASVNNVATSVTLTQGNGGNIRFTHTGGGALNVASATTSAGGIAITDTGSTLTLTGPVNATGGNITLTTISDGSIAVNNALTGNGASTVTLDSADQITAGAVITGASVVLLANKGIGGAGTVNFVAGTVSAVNAVNGNVTLATTGAAVASVLAAHGTGNLSFTKTGAGASVIDTASAESGSVTLSATGALNVNRASTVTGALTLTGTTTVASDLSTGAGNLAATATAGQLSVARLAAGGAATLTATGGAVLAGDVRATSVTATGAGVTINGTLDAQGGAIALNAPVAGNITVNGTIASPGSALTATDAAAAIQVNGTIDVATANLTAGTAIDGAGRITANTVALTAQTGIGAVTPLTLTTDSFAATTTAGDIAIDSQNARPVTGVASVTNAAGAITLAQTGGGALTVTGATTNNGAIALTSTGSDLTIAGGVTAGGASNITLRTITGGDVVLNGDVNAAGDVLTVDAARAIVGANRLTADTVSFTAGTSVGDLLVGLTTSATQISAVAGAGGINIANDSAVAVTVTSLTAGSGPIRFAQTGAANLGLNDVITGAGDITLSSQAGITVGNQINAGGNSTASLTAGAAINGSISGRVVAAAVSLNAQSGVGDPTALALDAGQVDVINGATGAVVLVNRHGTPTRAAINTASAAGGITFSQSGGGALILDNTSTANGAIDVSVTGADLTLAGNLTAGGANGITLTTVGAGDINLGGVINATGAVVLTAAGDIESTPTTGITAGSVTATAGGTITLTGVNAQTIAANGLSDVVVTINSAAPVNVPTLTAGGTGKVVFTQTGAGAVTFTTVSTVNGDVDLTTTGANLTVGGSVTAGGTGDVLLTTGAAAGNIVLTGTTTALDDLVVMHAGGSINGAGTITAGEVQLTAGLGLGQVTPLQLAAARITATNANGNIALVSALAAPVTVASITDTGAGSISLVHTGGPLTVGPVSAFNGPINLTATAGAMTTGAISSGAGAITLASTGGALTAAGPITTTAGAINLTATSANLEVTGNLTAGGAGPVTLVTNTSGDIRVTGDVTTIGGAATVTSAGAIEGGGLITAGSANLTATGGIGAGTRVRLSTGSFAAASTTRGDVRITSTSAAPTTATALSAAAGSIDVQHAGGGLLTVDAVTATSGSVSLQASGGGLTIAGAVSAGGTGSVLLSTLLAGDITLAGTTTAIGDTITVHSASAIQGAGRLTAGVVNLDATAGIGSATPLTVSAPVVTADSTGTGGIAINSNLAAGVTVGSLTAAGSGPIFFNQTGGGAVSFATVRTADGNVTLTSDTGRLTVEGPVTTGGSGNVLISTLTGNVVLAGPITANGAAGTIHSGGNITGRGLFTASSITLTALFGMGSVAEPLNLSSPSIAASSTGNGTLAIDNTTTDPTVASVLSVGGSGDLQFIQRGGGDLTVGIATAAAGSVRLENLSATPANLTLGTVVASADADIVASAGDIVDGFGATNVTASRVTFRAGRAVGTSSPMTTAVRTIVAEADHGSVSIAQAGAVDLEKIDATQDITVSNTSGDIRLGTLTAGRAILITAAGSILTLDAALTNLTTFGNADNRLNAGGVIGLSCDLPIRVNIDGTLTISPAGSINGISASIAGQIRPSGSFILANRPPGVVLFNCRVAPSEEQQEIDRANPGLVFQPFGFDLLSPYQTTAESRFDTSLRGLIQTRDAWDDAWTDELQWEQPVDAEAEADAREDRAAAEAREARRVARAAEEDRVASAKSRLQQLAQSDDEDAPPPPARRPRRTRDDQEFAPRSTRKHKPEAAPAEEPAHTRRDHKSARVDQLRDAWQQHADARGDTEPETATF